MYKNQCLSAYFYISLGYYKMLLKYLYILEPAYEILVRISTSINEGSGQPAQMRRLARAIAAHVHKV